MAKTNFTKVEEALKDGLDKMIKQKLLEEADAAQGKESKKQPAVDQLVAKIRQEIKILLKVDKGLFSKMGVEEKAIKELLNSSTIFTSSDWTILRGMLEKLEAYKQELEKGTPQLTDDQIIDKETKKHINKRFNVKDDWLPLR